MTDLWLAIVLMGVGLGAAVYAGVGLVLVVVLVRERIGWRCPQCRKRTLELIWWLESYPAPTPAYFECTACNARVSHVRPDGWRDAGDADFDKYYDGSTPGSINKRRGVAVRTMDEAAVARLPTRSTGVHQAHELTAR